MRSVRAFLLAASAFSFAPASQKPVRPPDDALVFRDVRVFDGFRMRPRETVVVRGGMIRAVGPDVVVPDGARIVDGRGKTLLPGLVDAHTHLGATTPEQYLRDALDFGVTTELEMFGSAPSLALRKRLAADPSGAPDLADFRTAGVGVTAPGGHPTQMGGPPFPTLAPGADAQAFVDARLAEGADFVKLIDEHLLPTLTTAQIADVVVAAHRRNALVAAHVFSEREARDAVAAGVDGLAHVFADVPPDSDFAAFAADHHVFVIPTLVVYEALTLGATAAPWWQGVPQVTAHLTPTMRGPLTFRFPPGPWSKFRLAYAERAVGALHRAGVPILAGTDAPAPGMAHGVSVHHELELLVASGLTPLQALAAATSTPARVFGFYDRGRVAVGLRADLLLVNGDPSADVRATRDIIGVWKLGVPHARHAAAAARGG